MEESGPRFLEYPAFGLMLNPYRLFHLKVMHILFVYFVQTRL